MSLHAAGSLTGMFPPTSPAEELTRTFFSTFQRQHPHRSLDDAILAFEQAASPTLEAFANSKQRSAASYRRVFAKFYRAPGGLPRTEGSGGPQT